MCMIPADFDARTSEDFTFFAKLACYPCGMERVLNVVRWVWVLTIWIALAFLVLELLAEFVAWYWPCEWAWQPFEGSNPHCPAGAD